MYTLQTALVIVSLAALAVGETLYEALSKDPELSEFYKMVNKDEVLQVLLDRRTITIFAPINYAVNRASGRKSLQDDTKLPSFHVLNLLATKDIFPASVAPYLAGVAPLFLSMKDIDEGEEKQYFVNNAKIIKEGEYRGTEGGKQLLYVIDELLEPYKPITTLPPTALDLLLKPSIYGITEPIDAFTPRVTSEQEKDMFRRVGTHTFFLPIGAVNQNTLREIDTWVVRSHVISKRVLFTRTMSKKPYRSETYNSELKVDLTIVNETAPGSDEIELYIQSNTIQSDQRHRKGVVRAKIVQANIPVSNGVVHLISNPLVVINITIWDFIEKEKNRRLSEFFNLVSRDPDFAAHLRSGDQKTIFAPTDEAFAALDSEKLRQIKENSTATKNLLLLHKVIESVSTEDVWAKNVSKHLSADNKRNLYFRVVGDERNKTLTVEGGGVNATAILADIGATNGIVHVINRVLGMPYLTVYSKLAHDPDLYPTFKLSEQEDWNRKLDDKEKRYTFFVPNRKAWEDLKKEMPSEHKKLNMGVFSYHVHKILDRHLVVGTELSREELGKLPELQMVHGMFTISPQYVDGHMVINWEGMQARIVRPDVQATNGIIHVIDRVMMKRRDLTTSSRSSSHHSSAVFWILSLLTTMKIVMCRQ